MDLLTGYKLKDKYTFNNNNMQPQQPAAATESAQNMATGPKVVEDVQVGATKTEIPEQKGSRSISPEAITARAKEVRAEEIEDFRNYGIELTQDQYDIINTQIANSTDPESTAYRYGTAMQYSRMLGIPLEDAMANVDRYNQAWWEGADKTEKDWYTAVSDAYTQGKNTLEMGRIGLELMDAENRGADQAIIDSIIQRYQMYSEQNAALEDNAPRAWVVDALKFGAQSAPFTIETGAASLIGGLIGPGAAIAAGFGVSAAQAAGLEYMEMRMDGADHTSASMVADISGALQGIVEVALGNLPALRAIGQTTGTVTKNLSGKLTANLFKRMHYSGTFKNIAQTVTHLGLEYAGEVTEEGLEEATQNIISELGKSLESVLSEEYDYDPKTIKQVAKESAEAFRGGFLGSLVLAGLPIAVNAKATYQEYADIRDSATNIQSKEEFTKQVKEKIKTGENHVFDGYTEEEQNKLIDNIYEEYESERQKNFHADDETIANIKESMDLDEGAEQQETDEEGERVAYSGEYRTDEGRIYIENDVEGAATEDGKIKGRVLAGDPTRPHATEESGNRYGYIDYVQDNDSITITDFKMSPGRESLAADFYEEFAEKFAGKNIAWSPKFEANTKLKQQLIAMNPNGAESGLNYFNSEESVNANRAKIKLSKDFKKWLPGWNNEQIAAGVALTQAAANAKGMSLDEYTNSIFQDGQMFAEVPNMEQLQQQAGEGQKILGAAQFDKDNRAIIYVTKYSDFNTFSHELGHIFRRNLDQGQLAEAADFYKVGDINNWTREEEEAFADGFVDYLRTGKAPTSGLKQIFEKAAKFIADIIRGLQGTIPINEQIRKVYDSLLEDDGSGLAQAIKAVDKSEKERIAAEKSAKYQEEQEKKQQQRAEMTEEQSAENIVENTINDSNLSTDEKAKTVVDTEGIKLVDDSQDHVLFQIISERLIDLIKDKAIKDSLQDKLETAKKYEHSDYSAEGVKRATGWYDDNGIWKYEIDDSSLNFKNRKALKIAIASKVLVGRSVELGALMEADREFWQAIPWIFPAQKIPIRFYYSENKLRSAITGDGININLAYVNSLDGEFGLKAIIVRRLQNLIQGYEGYVNKDIEVGHGITGEKFKDLFNRLSAAQYALLMGEKNHDVTELFKGLFEFATDAGELEAREVGRRSVMTSNDRRFSIPQISAKYEKAYYENIAKENNIPVQSYVELLFQTEAMDEDYMEAVKNNDIEKATAMVEAKAKVMGFDDAIPVQSEGYKLRTKAAPKKTLKVYKTFFVDANGKPSALFIDNNKSLPMNVWIDAKDAWHFTADNGAQYVPTTKNPNRNSKNGKTGSTAHIRNIPIEVKQELVDRGYISSLKTKDITAVAYRPGWHAGDMPIFPQGGKLGNPKYTPTGKPANSYNPDKPATNYQNMHEWNQVVFEVEIDADKDYTEIARSQPKALSKKGELIESNADLQYLPENGFYKYTTNPTVKAMMNGKGDWYISDSIKIIRALTEEECNEILAKNGLKPQEWADKDTGEIGKLDLAKLGYTGPSYDAVKKTLAPITYDEKGDVIPLSQRFNRENPSILYQTEGSRKYNTEYNPRSVVPTVRGGWTKKKILKYLKDYSTLSGEGMAMRLMAEFDTPQDLKEHMFYHGAAQGASKLKPSITMSDRDIERIGGGGYGEKYWAISVSKSKKIASRFSGPSRTVNIYPIVLAKNANIKEMPELEDSADLEDIIEDLYTEGVDAVWIGDKNAGEQELAVINPRAIVNIGRSDTYKVFSLGSKENPINIKDDEAIEKMFNYAKENVDKSFTPEAFGAPKKPGIVFRDDYDSEEDYQAAKEKQAAAKEEYNSKYSEWQDSEDYREYENALRERYTNIFFQTVYHGSPHKFDKFTTEKIGTGEGNQSFGWGLYFTNQEGIAREYAKTLVDEKKHDIYVDKLGKVQMLERTIDLLQKEIIEAEKKLDELNAEYEKLSKVREEKIKELGEGSKAFRQWDEYEEGAYLKDDKRQIANYKNQLEEKKSYIEIDKKRLEDAKKELKIAEEDQKTNLYTVEIPDEQYVMWDEKYEGEPLQRIKEALKERVTNDKRIDDTITEGITGAGLYHAIEDIIGSDKEASLFLKDMDYVGINYPANSISGNIQEGKRNFVIFSDEDIEVNSHILFQLIGEVGARNLDDFYNTSEKIDNLEIAKEMKERKLDAKKIKLATGWELGVDGKWKYELDTSKYKFVSEEFFTPLIEEFNETHPKAAAIDDFLLGNSDRTEPITREELELLDYRDEIINQRKASFFGDKATIADFVRSEELFEAYPELKNIGLKFYKESKGSVGGEYNRYSNNINIYGVDLNNNSFLEVEIPSILVHEIQHAIQKIEGFARGGNKESITDSLADLFYADVQESRQYSSDALKYREVHAKISAIDFIKEIRRLEDNPGRILKTGYWQGHSWAVPSKRNKADYDNYLYERISGYIMETKEAIQKSLNPNSSGNIVDELIKYEPESLAEMRKDLKKQENKVKKNAFKYFDLKEDIDFLSRKMEENPYQAYTELAGETEARNVERRMYMTDKERRAKLLAETADVSASDQIVLFQLASELNKAAIEPDDDGKKLMQSLIVAKIMEAQDKPGAAISTATGWEFENDMWQLRGEPDADIIAAYADNSMYATNINNVNVARSIMGLTRDVEPEKARAMGGVQQILFQRVYHGTAADFNEFSMEHINEGEGSQSFGRGLYFTDNEDIATDYAQRQKAQKEGKGYVYTAEIPDNNLVKWDENLDEATIQKVARVYADDELENIQGASDWTEEEKAGWAKNKDQLSNVIINAYNYSQADGQKFSGADLYYLLMSKAGYRSNDANEKKKLVAKWMNKAGILGFDYPAGTKWGDGNGSRNFVIFDDKDVNIVNKIFFQKVDEKSLVGVHNLSEEALRHAIKMGGLPNPSMAVIDTSKNPDFSSYGEITLVAPTWLIDKKEGRNAGTFGADIYSPRYPRIKTELTKQSYEQIGDIVSNVRDEKLKSDVIHKIENYIEDGKRYIYDSGFPVPYLLEKGEKDFIVKEKEKYSEDTIARVFALGYKKYDIIADDPKKAVELSKIYMDVDNDFKNAKKLDEKTYNLYLKAMKEEDNPDSINYNLLRNFLTEILHQSESTGKVDSYQTMRNAYELVREKYADDFKSWVNDKVSTIDVNEKIYAGENRDGTNKYLPHTLANVSKIMKKAGLRGGEGFNYGLGYVRAMFTPKFSSLSAIKKNKSRLISKEEFEQVKQKYDPIFDDVIDILGDGDLDLGSARLIEAWQDTRGAGIGEYIENNYDIELSSEDKAKIVEFIGDMESLPTEYFETKFERPVEFNEFVGAVIPQETPQDIKDFLQEQGIIIQEYAEDERGAAIAALKDTIGQRRNILFQTEKEMLDEAATFTSWEEWKDFYSVFWEGEADAAAPSPADDNWYKSTWEKAIKIAKENEYSDEIVKKVISQPDTDDEDQKDIMWYSFMEEEGSLDQFLKTLANTVFESQWQPADAEEAAQLEEFDRLRGRYNRELRHGYWSTGALAARQVEAGETVPLSERHRKTLMTLIRNNKRDYRDIYADFMGEPAWSVAEDKKTAAQLAKRMTKSYKIASPHDDFEAMTPEQRKSFANKLDFEDLKKELKEGTMTMDLDSVQKLADGYDNEIKILDKKIKSLKESDTENAETIVKLNAMIDKAYEEMKTKQEAKSQAEGVRDIKIRLIKNVNKRVDFKRIAYDEGKKIIAIQTLFHPILRKFVNKFINMEGPYIRDAYSRYKTDLDYRAKMNIIASESRSRNAKKLIELMDNKPFDKWTTEDKELAAKTLPRTNWLDQLRLDELEKKRAGSLQLDLQSEETQKLLAEALPPDLLALLTAKDLRTWTLEEMESLVAVVNELFKEGRNNLRAKQEAEQLRADKFREAIKRELKSSGIQINEDDTPEEKKRKKKAQEKWEKKHLPRILGIENEIKGTVAASAQRQTFLNKILNGFGDANIRRVSRILDNGHEGVNSNLLFYMENLCFNKEQRAIQSRTEKINKILEENNITLDDLYKQMDVTFPDGTIHKFTVDELLFMEAANADDMSRAAVACGNMYDESVKELYRGSMALQEEYEQKALAAYYECLKVAETIPDNIRKLLGVIQADYDAQYDEMNRVSIDEYNQPVWRVEHYVPLNRLESNGDENANRQKEDLLAASGSYAKTFGWVDRGMTNKRVEISPANQRPVQLGLYSTWTESMQRTEHFIAYAGYLRELNRIYKGRNSGAIRQLMENRYGRGMTSYIDQYINETANPNALNPKTQLDRIVRALRGKTAPAYLGWKMSGIIKQLCTSPWPFMQYVSPWKYAAAAIEFATKPEVRDAIKAKSAYMNSRVYDPIVDILNEQKEKTINKFNHGLMSFESVGMKGLEMVDWCCVAPGWLAIYKEEYARLSSDEEQDKLVQAAMKKYEHYSDVNGWDWVEAQAEAAKLTEAQIIEKAVEKADDITRMCQPSARATDLSPIFKESNEMTKVFLQFTTSLNVIWQNIRYDLPIAVRNRQYQQIVGTIAGYVLAGITMGLVTGGLGDDDDEPEKKAGQLAFYAMSQFTDSVPVIGSIVSNTVESTLTKEWRMSNNNMFPITTKAVNMIRDVSKEDWAKAAGDFGEAMGLSLGLPVSGTKEILEVAGVGHDEGFYPQALVGRRADK